MGITAERIKITPIDTSRLRTGYRITEEVIPPDVVRDEKKELFGQELQKGQLVAIEYSINSRAAGWVVYEVSDILPPNADQIGEPTTVEIEGEKPKDNQFISPDCCSNGRLNQKEKQIVRHAMQARLEFLMDEIGRCEEEDLDASKLRDAVEALEGSLGKHF